MADMDQGIKRLLQSHPQDFLALALPGARYLRTDPVDLAQEPPLVLDSLLRVQYHGVECLVDIEAEARPRPTIGGRLFNYGTRAMNITGLPVLSVVLWLESGGKVPSSPYQVWLDDIPIATWHFVGIEMYTLSTDDLIARGEPGLLPLAPFTCEGGDFDTFVRVAHTIKEQAPASDLVELEVVLGVFASRRFEDARVLEVIREVLVSTEIIGTSKLYQRWVREATEKGLAEGEAKGLAEGEAKGEAKGLHEALTVVLRGRFGALPADLEQAITVADTALVTSLLAQAAAVSLEDVRAQLGV